MKVFYIYNEGRKFGRIIDVVGPNDLGLYSQLTKEQLATKWGGEVSIIEQDINDRSNEACFLTEPTSIDEEKWTYWLECLPPSKWQRAAGGEGFFVCERIAYNVVTWCVRLGEDYFTFNGFDTMSTTEAVTYVATYVKALQPA